MSIPNKGTIRPISLIRPMSPASVNTMDTGASGVTGT